MPQVLYPDIINKLPLFAGLSDAEKCALLSHGKIKVCERGRYLFHHGEPIQHFYIVCSGLMQLVRASPDGDAITTDVIIPGKTISKNEIFRNYTRHHQVSALVVEDAVVVEFPAAWLRKVALENQVVALNILASLSQYSHMLQIEFEHKSTMTTSQQVACFLQRLCLMHELDPCGFQLPYSKTLIASRLGMEPETFSRALSKLRQHGIEVNNMHVSFRSLDEVDEHVCDHCSIMEECTTHTALQQKAARKTEIC